MTEDYYTIVNRDTWTGSVETAMRDIAATTETTSWASACFAVTNNVIAPVRGSVVRAIDYAVEVA